MIFSDNILKSIDIESLYWFLEFYTRTKEDVDRGVLTKEEWDAAVKFRNKLKNKYGNGFELK